MLIWVVIGFSSIWVWRDAGRREWSEVRFASRAWMWPVGTLLAWIIVLPIYLFQRNRVPVKG